MREDRQISAETCSGSVSNGLAAEFKKLLIQGAMEATEMPVVQKGLILAMPEGISE